MCVFEMKLLLHILLSLLFLISITPLQQMSTRHARTADRASNEKNAKVLKALLQKTPNKYCADCKKKGESSSLMQQKRDI